MTAIHVFFIITTGLFVLYSDEQALAWMLGKKRTLSARKIDILHVIVSIGLSAIIATGGIMLLNRLYLLSEPTFLTKMVFVAGLIINGLFIDRLSVTATERPFAELSRRERLPLLISGAVSGAGWVGAALCGLLLG